MGRTETVIPHNRLSVDDRDVAAVAAVVRGGYWACGPRTRELEARLAERVGVGHVVCVNSGSSALRLALQGLGIGRGDVVAIPAYCCVALANAVLAMGAKPLPVDVVDGDWTLDPERLVAPPGGIRAVVTVNQFGVPAEVAALRRRGTWVIEDCAHALGITCTGDQLGARGDVAVTSFYATKLIGGGEGGAVLTDRADVARSVRDGRDYTDLPAGAQRGNFKNSDLHSALALSQLSRLDELLAARAERARNYSAAFAHLENAGVLALPRWQAERVWYRYVVRRPGRPAEETVAALSDRGIDAARPVEDWRAARAPSCPVADRIYREAVSLPLYPALTAEQQQRVCQAVMDICLKT